MLLRRLVTRRRERPSSVQHRSQPILHDRTRADLGSATVDARDRDVRSAISCPRCAMRWRSRAATARGPQRFVRAWSTPPDHVGCCKTCETAAYRRPAPAGARSRRTRRSRHALGLTAMTSPVVNISDSAMEIDYPYSLSDQEAWSQLALLGGIPRRARHGIKVTWVDATRARFSGKYLIVKIDGDLTLGNGHAQFKGEDRAFLWRNRAKGLHPEQAGRNAPRSDRGGVAATHELANVRPLQRRSMRHAPDRSCRSCRRFILR